MTWAVKDFAVEFGGQQPTGWLPDNATMPLPTPTRKIICDFAIEREGDGFLLLYESKSGAFWADNWFKTKAQAIQAALNWYSIPPGLWRKTED